MTVAMDENVKGMWVAALRSGEYVQGAGQLCKRSSIRTGRTLHCCLGVLCELAIAAGVPVERTVSNWQTEVSFDGEAGTLPASVRHWAGLTDSDPIVGNGPATLAGLNDDMLVGFAEIATIIEGGL